MKVTAESLDLQEERAQSGATRELAGFVAGLRHEHIPVEVIAKAKACVLDAIGCILFGSTLPWTRIVADAARDEESAPQATLIGTADRASVLQAVLKNEALSEELRGRMLAWRHGGFSAHNEVSVAAEDTEGRKKIAGYMLRAPMSLQKMTYDAATGHIGKLFPILVHSGARWCILIPCRSPKSPSVRV